MSKHVVFVFTLGLLAAVGCSSRTSKTSGVAASANAPSPVGFELPKADVKAGERIHQQGTANSVAACLACHGAQGEGQAAAGFPRLANQSRLYMVEQLHNYKNDVRVNPVMGPIAKAMSDQEMQDVSAFLEQITPPPFAPSPKLTSLETKRGRLLVNIGDQRAQVQSCANCHGAGGKGEAPGIPYIGGQVASYTEAQLLAWKNGNRKSSQGHMMVIANLLSAKDIKAVSLYLQAVPNIDR